MESWTTTRFTGSLMKPAERRASAAPLAGVWRVEDGGTRQLPGNARAADHWSAGGFGRQARLKVAGCRVDVKP